jgi:HAD superfamily hydrolase (TIGR01509 family)
MSNTNSPRAYFFDMDGVLFDSMPNHAVAWEEVMKQHRLPFTAYDCYLNEGRTGESVIREAMWTARNRDATPDEIATIYAEKSAYFTMLEKKAGGTPTIPGVAEVLQYIQSCGHQIWVVTGSGMRSLLDNLNTVLPPVFLRDRMINAFDVVKGKPDPEPYLKAWERSGLAKDQCVVIENAPLGVRSGKAAGLKVYAVNTGVLSRNDLLCDGADKVFDSMVELLEELKKENANKMN